MAKKAKRKKVVEHPLRERNPKNPNYDRAGRWVGPEK